VDSQNNGQPPALVGDVVRSLPLPSGGEVVFRDPHQLKARDKRQVINNVPDGGGTWSHNMDVFEGTIALLVERWTIPYLANAPLPRDEPAILGELEIPDYDALVTAAGPAVRLLFPRTSADDADKPGSPTGPASA
jgi:hypothetical protein